jgi:hypothetical protein
LWIFGVWLVGALVFFREQWDSGFKSLQGNDGDTRLAAYFAEHWFQVLHGQASWLNPSFFYPVKGVLGWSDTFFLYEVFYAPLRLLGADPFLALQLTVIIFSLIGFVTFVYLVRLGFGTPLPAALACGLFFTFSNALWFHVSSVQLSGIWLVPSVPLLALLAWRAARAGRRSRAGVFAGVAGLLWALILYSTYYVGWFSTLGLVIVAILLMLVGGMPFIRRALSDLRAGSVLIIFGLAGLAIGLIPFVRTYLPTRHQLRYSVVLQFAGSLRDVVNVGYGNVLWSHLLTHVVKTRASNYELSYAVTPVVMLLTVGGGAIALWLLLSHRQHRLGVARLAVALAGTAIVLTLLPLHTRFGTPWAIIWHLPGASAMRAIDRVQVVTSMFAALTIAAAATEVSAAISGWRRPRAWQSAVLVLLAVALVEQLNTTPNSSINRQTQVRLLQSTPAPPQGCRAFYVVDSAAQLPYYEYQVDAMLLQQKFSLPTINGYSGSFPPNWGLVRPWLPTYAASVTSWEQAHNLTNGLCRLDLATMTWSPSPVQSSG